MTSIMFLQTISNIIIILLRRNIPICVAQTMLIFSNAETTTTMALSTTTTKITIITTITATITATMRRFATTFETIDVVVRKERVVTQLFDLETICVAFHALQFALRLIFRRATLIYCQQSIFHRALCKFPISLVLCKLTKTPS